MGLGEVIKEYASRLEKATHDERTAIIAEMEIGIQDYQDYWEHQHEGVTAIGVSEMSEYIDTIHNMRMLIEKYGVPHE